MLKFWVYIRLVYINLSIFYFTLEDFDTSPQPRPEIDRGRKYSMNLCKYLYRENNLSSKAIGCQWVCVFVCFETANPNELKFWDMNSWGFQTVLGKKKAFGFDQPFAGKSNKR